MSQKPNPTSIGLFIVIGVALGVAGLLLFSSSRLFTRTLACIVYFNESLAGLQDGAPVKYRGVIIGSVKRVMVRYNQATNDFAMPVIIELQERLIQERMGEPLKFFTADFLEERIRNGMRASLRSDSLVTGVLYVDLFPDPQAPPPVFHQIEKRYPEIPTEPTQVQELLNDLASLDLKALSTNVNALLAKMDTVLTDLRMAEISAGVTNTLASFNRLASSPEITNALVSVQTTLEQYRTLGRKVNGRIDSLAESLTNTLSQATLALAQLQGTAGNLRGMLRPDAPLQQNLDELLRQLTGTAESATSLLEFLRQHPNALITGRENPQKP
jgi:paraquat-inducible protein B